MTNEQLMQIIENAKMSAELCWLHAENVRVASQAPDTT